MPHVPPQSTHTRRMPSRDTAYARPSKTKKELGLAEAPVDVEDEDEDEDEDEGEARNEFCRTPACNAASRADKVPPPTFRGRRSTCGTAALPGPWT